MLIIAQHHKITFVFFFFSEYLLIGEIPKQMFRQCYYYLFLQLTCFSWGIPFMEISLRINLIGHNLKFGTSSWYFHSDF